MCVYIYIYDILSQTNSTLLTADMISFCMNNPVQKCSSTFPFLNKKHKLHKVYCQVVYVTFDISVTKKIKCSLAGAYNGKKGGGSNKK